MPPFSSQLGEPSREQAKLHRTASRAAWVADPTAPTARAIFDPDAGSDKPPQLYPVWSTTGAELGAIGGEGLRLYFTLIKGLTFLWLAMATAMCVPLALNAGGEMYILEVSSHFSDLYLLASAAELYPGAPPLGDRQAWRSLRAKTTLGAITRSRSTNLPNIKVLMTRKKCWGKEHSDKKGDVLCDCIPGFVPHSDDVGQLATSCLMQPTHPLCTGEFALEACPAASGFDGNGLSGGRRRLDDFDGDFDDFDSGDNHEADDAADDNGDSGGGGGCSDGQGDGGTGSTLFSCGAADCGASASRPAPNCDCQEHSLQATAYGGGGLEHGSQCQDQVEATERTLLLYSAFDVISIIAFVVGSVLLQRRLAAAAAETNAAGITMSDYSVLIEPPENWTLGGDRSPDSPAEFKRQLEEHLEGCKWPVATQKDGSSCIWPIYVNSQHIQHWATKVKLIDGLVEEVAAATQASNEGSAEQAEHPKVEKALHKLRRLNAKAKEKKASDSTNGVAEAAIVSLRSEADRCRATEQTVDFCGQQCISVVQAPEPNALNFGHFEITPARRALRARLAILLQFAILGMVMISLQTLYSSVPAVPLPCDQMKFAGTSGMSTAGARAADLADLAGHRKAWADSSRYCTDAECSFVGGQFTSDAQGTGCVNQLEASKQGVCDGVDPASVGLSDGIVPNAVAQFYKLRWQIVEAVQTVAAYPSLETEGHNLEVCDESEFETKITVAGNNDLVKADIPWAQASSKDCHRKYDENYPRFTSAVRLPLGSSLDASCYHCMCECYTSGKVPQYNLRKGLLVSDWPSCPNMVSAAHDQSSAGDSSTGSDSGRRRRLDGGCDDDTVDWGNDGDGDDGGDNGGGSGDEFADPSLKGKSDEEIESYPDGAKLRGMADGYCDEYVAWKAGVNRRKTISGVAVTVVNQLAAVGWKQLIKFEKRVSLGKQQVSLAQKVFVFQFLNTVGLTILLNSQLANPNLPVVGDGKWYYTVGADLIQIMMMNVVVPPTVHVVKFVVQRVLQSLAKARTQVVLNKKFEPPAWNLAASLGEVLFISWTTLTLSTGMPIMLWIGAVGLGLKYWVDKWAVLQAYAKPPMYGTDVFDSLPTHLYLMAVAHLMAACYLLKVSGGVTPESLEGTLNLVTPVKAVPLVAGGTTSAEGAWPGGYDQAHVLPPLILLVCLVTFGAVQAAGACVKTRSSSHKTKVVAEPGTVVSVVPPAADTAAIGEEDGGGGASPEFAVALRQGLIINSHDNYEIREQVELAALQEEVHAMFASDKTLVAKLGAETVKSILAEVGEQLSVKDTGTYLEQRQGGPEGIRPEKSEDLDEEEII